MVLVAQAKSGRVRTNVETFSFRHSAFDPHSSNSGDWKRGNGHRETIKIVGTDIARPDNAAPDQT